MVYRRKPYLVKDKVHMARTAQINIEKRQPITLRDGQSMQKITDFESFFVQSQKPSSAMMELSLMRTSHRKGRPRVTSAAEDKFIRVTSLRN